MKFTTYLFKFLLGIIPAVLLISCSDAVDEEKPAEKASIPAPKKVSTTPTDVIANTDAEAESPAEDERPRSERGKGGRGDRPDYRNMTEEERREARRERIAQMDTNGDGQIGKDEMPERAWEFFSRADKDGDDRISEAEGEEFRAEMEAEREIRELTGEGGGGFGRPPGFGGNRDGKGGGKGGGGGEGKGTDAGNE